MANTKSAKKRIRQTIRKTARNKGRKSQVKTAIKNAYTALQQSGSASADQLRSVVTEAVSIIMKAAGKGIVTKKTAARKVSRLTKALNAAGNTESKISSPEESTPPAVKTSSKSTATKKPAAKKKAAPAKKKKAATKKK